MRNTLYAIFLTVFSLTAVTLEVGQSYPYDNLRAAANDASPGDTILFHEGIYSGDQYVADLQGEQHSWIYILSAPNENVVIDSSTQAWHFPEGVYLYISGFTFQHQSGNGVNVDDGSSYETPAHHITFDHCIFKDMAATGNNDQLKMSGVDTFTIQNCTFKNGSAGGSGIDFVGCHNGTITQCVFENQGANAIQAKGGSQYITIHRNLFKNGGQRSINLGGSTGLDYFRPDTAHFEAADLNVYSNIFIGSYAPIAYVGCVNVKVINNTIYKPDHWVIRILQETVDPNWFHECGDNIFRNNIIYLGNSIATECNVGPNTRPETFIFSNNLWYHFENSSWNGPSLPVTDDNNIIQQDPLFKDPDNDDFTVEPQSPVGKTGYSVLEPVEDYLGNRYSDPRSIGAIEAFPILSIGPTHNFSSEKYFTCCFLNNSPHELLHISFLNTYSRPTVTTISIYNLKGIAVSSQQVTLPAFSTEIYLPVQEISPGMYSIVVYNGRVAFGKHTLYVP